MCLFCVWGVCLQMSVWEASADVCVLWAGGRLLVSVCVCKGGHLLVCVCVLFVLKGTHRRKGKW